MNALKNILLILSFLITTSVNAQSSHYLSFKNPTQLHRYFSYSPDKKIISGHRGSIENGLPENSIAAFEEVLKHTPAFFEIDPRLTKDSVAVLMHDATLDRTTNGKGKLSDYTWEEVKQLKLKDSHGNLTEHRIPTLSEAIEWARGKTILNFDKKDLPMELTARIIQEHNAASFIMVTVHTVDQAKFYLSKNKKQMMSAFVKTPADFKAYQEAKIPFKQMIAYIGPDIKDDNKELYSLLNSQGTMCMISSAPTYDKLKTKEERAKAYTAIFNDGASILESDFPIEVSMRD